MPEGRVVALIAARDEAGHVGATVAATLALPDVSRVVVADDGSRDTTAGEARAAGAAVVPLPHPVGKGDALNAAAAEAGAARAFLLLDADLGASAAEACALLGPVLSGSADMTIAVLPTPPGSGGFGLVLRLARWGIRRLTAFEPRAPLSGQRALSAEALRRTAPFAPGFGVEVALTVRALRAGLRVAEVDAPMEHRPTGRTPRGFLHRGRQFADVAAALVRLAAERGVTSA